MEETTKAALKKAISALNKNRAKVLKLAYEQNDNDPEAVTKVEEDIDALRSAYADLLKKELDSNSANYEKIMVAAGSEAEKLQKSIDKLNNISETLRTITSLIELLKQVKEITL